MRVFADTSGFFAAVVRNDSQHPRARPALARLLEEGAEVHTTSYVLLETLALLHSRVSRDAVLAFEHDLRPLLRVRWVDEDLHAKAVRRMKSLPVTSVSLVDCASFVAMDEEGLKGCFGYDRHFEQQGFRLLSDREDLQS